MAAHRRARRFAPGGGCGRRGRGGPLTLRVLHDEQAIRARVEGLAQRVATAAPTDLLVVGVLKGSFIFVADLVRALDRLGVAPEVEFMRLSSYGRSREGAGVVRLLGEPPAPVSGRNVLLVDDIADTGRSLDFARTFFVERGAAQVLTCVLLDKPSRRRVPFAPEFVGFEVGDEFVVGYGLDEGERFRHLPYLAVAESE